MVQFSVDEESASLVEKRISISSKVNRCMACAILISAIITMVAVVKDTSRHYLFNEILIIPYLVDSVQLYYLGDLNDIISTKAFYMCQAITLLYVLVLAIAFYFSISYGGNKLALPFAFVFAVLNIVVISYTLCLAVSILDIYNIFDIGYGRSIDIENQTVSISTSNKADLVLDYITKEYIVLQHLIRYQRNRLLVTIPCFMLALYFIQRFGLPSAFSWAYVTLAFLIPYLINISNVYLINSSLTLVEERLNIRTHLKASLFQIDIEHAWLISLVYFMITLSY